MPAYSPQIASRLPSPDGAAGLFPLLVVLVVGILAYFPVSPGTVPTDVMEVMLPLGIAGGFVVLACLKVRYVNSSSLDAQFDLFSWLGAVIGGMIGLWFLINELRIGSSFAIVYRDALTILSIGTAVGALVAIATTSAYRSPSPLQTDPERILAESTWTNRSGRDPIVMELVEQLSELEDVDPLNREPLASSINTEAVRVLRTGGGSPWQLRFWTAEYEIRVSSQGTITVLDDHQRDEGPTTGAIPSAPEHSDTSYSSNGSHENGPQKVVPLYPAGAIYEAVAEHEQVEPADLPPLEEWVHPTILDAVTRTWKQLHRSREFQYLWYHVTVHPNGEVSLRA